MELRLSPAWDQISGLLESRLVDARERLEQADETNFRFEQGRVHELRFFLELEDTAKAVLDRERTPKRIPAID